MVTPTWNGQRWEIDTTIRGERFRAISRIAGDKGAKACLKRYNLALGGLTDRRTERLKKTWPDYLAYIKKLHPNGADYDQRESYGRNYILPQLGTKKVGSITKGDWQDCILDARSVKAAKPSKAKSKSGKRAVKDRVPGEKMLSEKSYKNLRSTIMSFCKWAYDHEMIDRLPLNLKIPSDAEEVGKKILMPDELVKLFSDPPEPEMRHYVNAWRLMVILGLRPGEIFGLQKADVINGELTIKRAINSKNQVTKGKNKRAARPLMLPKHALSVLKNQAEYRAKIPGLWIFPEEDGGQPLPNRSRYWFNKYFGDHVTPYGLRHTYNSLMAEEMPESLRKRTMGHSKNMDTDKVYYKPVDGSLQKAADIIDKVLDKWLDKNLG